MPARAETQPNKGIPRLCRLRAADIVLNAVLAALLSATVSLVVWVLYW